MLLLFCNVCGTRAQSPDEFCGDWVGTYTQTVPDPDSDGLKEERVRMYIRINKMDHGYTVRIKTQSPGEDMKYWPSCENVSRNGNSLQFTMDVRYCYDWDASDKKNGQCIEYAHYVFYSSVSVTNGTMLYKDNLHTTYYGSSGEIGEHVNPSRKIVLNRNDGW